MSIANRETNGCSTPRVCALFLVTLSGMGVEVMVWSSSLVGAPSPWVSSIVFGTTSWKNGTCLFIDPNVIQLKRIVCPKKVDACTLEDPLACMDTIFVWYDFLIKFCINLLLIFLFKLIYD